ncbi:hypothetical protein ACS0TY_029950 [Phlomoides rotata]
MGSYVFNAKLCLALKQILNLERPNSTLRSDPGMPSSHAQSITYTTVFIILSNMAPVSQNLHTVGQVVVGAIIGSSFSFLWLWSWKAYVLNFFVSILWVRALIILAATGFVLNHLNCTYRSSMEE